MAERTMPVSENKKKTGFQPGNPGGPGRPKGSHVVGSKAWAYSVFEKVAGDNHELAEKALARTLQDAAKGKPAAQRILIERLWPADILDRLDEWRTRGELRDRDFLHYRLHKAASDVQRTILFSRERIIMAMAGRRGGKTKGWELLFSDKFAELADARCLYISLTVTHAMELLWQPMLDRLEWLGIKIADKDKAKGHFSTEGGGFMKFGGNHDTDEREKNRGPFWDLVIIDEMQSQKELKYLVEHVLEPTLIDRQGTLAFSGTGPKIRGTYWEMRWTDGKPALRLNFTLRDNPFIKDHDKMLEEIRREKGLAEKDPLYVREYLGGIAYDDDALVLRLDEQNYFSDDELAAWIASQPITDIRFVGGLDFGFVNSDAFGIICYSISSPERFLVYEYKTNRVGTAELAGEIRKGIQYVRTSSLFQKVEAHHREDWFIHADTGGNAITAYDLSMPPYSLPVQAAYKQQEEMAFEMLQTEVRTRQFKCRKGGEFDKECLSTIYKRDEQDHLTREIDDETFHPDVIPAVNYGMRSVWLFATGGKE